MVRLACINVRNLPLQILLRKHPGWRRSPTAVLSKSGPLGMILSVNRRAVGAGIEPGMRFAAGLSLDSDLHGDEVSRWEVEETAEEAVACLQGFTPDVEPRREEPGVFWLGARGLSGLYPTERSWIQSVIRALERMGLHASAAVGFTRFGSYAASKTSAGTRRRLVVFTSFESERRHALESPMSTLPLHPGLMERLEKLGLRSVGSFIELTPGSVRRRFGAEAVRLHRFARGGLSLPLQPLRQEERQCLSKSLLAPVSDKGSILFHLEELLDLLLRETRSRSHLVMELGITLNLEDGATRAETIRPASPSADRKTFLELIALRLDTLILSDGVVSFALSAATVEAGTRQLLLFQRKARRSREAGTLAFARIRAVYGNDAVRTARLEDSHLPEQSYTWDEAGGRDEAGGGGRETEPTDIQAHPNLVRRILSEPIPLSLPRGGRRIKRLTGPYLLSGGWWRREYEREYYFAESSGGEILWIYYDRRSRSWMLAGRVE